MVVGQKYVMVALCVASCATQLQKPSDIKVTAKELEQKIEELPPAPESSLSASPLVAGAGVKPVAESEDKLEKKKKAAPPKKEKKPASARGAEFYWTPKNWPFGIGEKLTFAVRYGPIEGGIVTLEVKAPKIIDGVPALHYYGTARSSRVLELFYKIENTMNSFVALSSHLPIRQEMEQAESARTGKRVVVFDQEKKVVKYYSKLLKSNGQVDEVRRDDAISNNAQDIFGAIFFYRFIEDLKRANFPVHDRWKEWNSDMKFLGPETVRVGAGEFKTLRFGVTPRISGNLESKGAAEIWVTDDDRKILVKFNSKVKIGSITGELKEYRAGSPINYPVPNLKTPANLKDLQ